jgi:signal transduction histidine kinase
MASVPSDTKPVLGRVDRDGHLIAADPQLERLQLDAGSSIGGRLALPQLAAVVRVAQRLQIPVSRRILAAGPDHDIDMWVRAVPDGDDVALTIDQWTPRPVSPPRLATIVAIEHERLAALPLSWSVDEHLRIVTMAPALAEHLSLDAQSAVGQPLTRLFRLEEDSGGEMPVLAALVSKTDFSDQHVTARATGRQLVMNGEAVLSRDGIFAGFEGSAVVANVESRPVIPEPLADRAIHSALRSPLDSIVRSAEDMIDRSDSPAGNEYAVYAADIAAAAKHLLSVIRSLGEQDTPQRHQVDLADLTTEAVGLIETAASDRGIAIAVQPMGIFTARGEARSVVQILVNLIGNAARYSHEGTTVTVSFERARGLAMVHVADEGPGIDPVDHERIFEPFEQAQNGNGGSGLGLAISRRLARAMGGDIRLESVPGDGARFTLFLPSS